MEDLSKLPANVAVELLPPAAGSGELRPAFVVTQHNAKDDMLLDMDSSSDSTADEDDYDTVDNDDDDGSAGMFH